MRACTDVATRSLILSVLCLVFGSVLPTAAAPAEARDQIAFENDGDIYTVEANGGNLRRLTRSRDPEHQPRWSPDGTKIAYERDIEIGFDRDEIVRQRVIYVMNADGSGQRRLSPPRVTDSDPTWSPDGRTLAFVRSGLGDLSNDLGLADDIWLMNADGSGSRRLTRGRTLDRDPDWAPDGRRIAYVEVTPNNLRVFVINTNGTGRRPLVGKPHGTTDPRWSPDGRRVAFLGWKDKNLYAARPTGAEKIRLAGHAEVLGHHDPQWSPDGSRIAYEREGLTFAVLRSRPTAGASNPRIRLGGQHEWSPDGRELAFIRLLREKVSIDLHVVAADGAVRRLTHGEAVQSPAWRPRRG